MRASTGSPALERSRQCSAANRPTAKWPLRWTRTTASHSSSPEDTNMRSRTNPALLTTTSSPPKASTAVRTRRRAPSQSATSSPLTTALAPWRANSSACARPMPRAAPVTITTRPSQIPVMAGMVAHDLTGCQKAFASAHAGRPDCPATVEAALHLTPIEYAVALAVVALGTVVQGSVGFGVNLLAVPVLAVVEPDALPPTLTLLALPLGTAMARRERHGVDWPGVGWFMVGRLPGTVLGALVVASVAGDTISVLAGSGVLLAVGISLMTATVRITPGSTMAAGVASGAMGTATSIGGPPLALLYQHRGGAVLRGTPAVTV